MENQIPEGQEREALPDTRTKVKERTQGCQARSGRVKNKIVEWEGRRESIKKLRDWKEGEGLNRYVGERFAKVK